MGDMISSLLFQPPTPTFLHPSRHFWLTTELGHRIPAFFIERPSASVTILFSHGNAEDLGMIYDWFNDLSRVLRVNIMAYDYTGYGKSQGAPHEMSCYADIEAAYRYLLTVRGLQPEQIVLYGRSLGSGPSCYLAAKTAKEGRSVAAVILQSPLLSAYRVAFNFRFTCIGDKFPNVDYAPNIRCPVFIVHGTQDEVVPFWHGEELFMALRKPWRAKPFWVDGAGHNNIEALLRPTGAFVDKFKYNYDNGELIDRWTSAFLAEFERPKSRPKRKSPKPRIVFGRTTYPQSQEDTRPQTSALPPGPRFSLFAGTELSHNRQQLHNFKIDLSKAREKRKRQLQYSREVALGAKSQKQRDIDSISRIVVQSFRKLIDCERCALFLMDEAKKELYFKPVGDSDHSHARLKAIRFSATSGVAGWVASNKMMCNIKNAHHQKLFTFQCH
ncbi:hypothetical protein ACHAW6_003629 [Cyclotella cf. meneghiniana]